MSKGRHPEAERDHTRAEAATMAAARRIYNVRCATDGCFAPTGYRSFGLRLIAHAAISAWPASG
jgi:hypothetical protein